MAANFNQIMQSAAVATGNGTAIDIGGLSSLVMQITGTFVGTVTFEATINNTDWVAVQIKNRNSGKLSTITTGTGLYSLSVAGLLKVRARISAYTSGSVTVEGYATALPMEQQVSGIDSTTFAQTTIAYPHHEIHGGSHYYIENHTTLADAAILRVALVTPDTTKWGHFTWNISSTGILTTEFYEGASVSGGSGVTPINNNRNSSNTSGFTITSGVSASSDGTLISAAKWGTTGFKDIYGGGGGREDELVLKQNETYMRKFISGSALNVVSFKATWYEHTNRV